MKILSAFVVFAVLLAQFGCSTYNIDRIDDNPGPKLDPSDSAYVCLCEDGRFHSKVYQGSGLATTQIIFDKLSKHLSQVEKGQNPEACDEALNTALYSGHNYLICPSILHWEDHTELIDVRDKITIQIIVIDTLTGNKIDGVVINGKSRFMSHGTEKPQDLLATPIQAYVDSLFQ
jgi:hypothetical protein